MKTKSPLSWFGSDSKVAAELAAMLDNCKHVTIPFFGGASILPHLKAKAIVANDLHEEAINFYRILSSGFTNIALVHRCMTTLSHPSEIYLANLIINETGDNVFSLCITDRINRAWAFWAQCWLGRKGKGGTKNMGGKVSIRRTANGGNNASRLQAVKGDLEAWAKQFERCEFECSDAIDVIDSVADKEGCGIYCDPPWVGAGDSYVHSFDEKKHKILRESLRRFEKAEIVVRYGDDPLIRELYDGWRYIERTSKGQANNTVSEIWFVKNL